MTRRRCTSGTVRKDDAALVAHTERALQYITTCFSDAAHLFDLEVSLQKTKVLHQPAPQEDYHPPIITIGKTVLKSVQQFTYQGLYHLFRCQNRQRSGQQAC